MAQTKSKQKKQKDVHQFVVLNHILFSKIASVATTVLSKEERNYPSELVHIAKKARTNLVESAKKLATDEVAPNHVDYAIKPASTLNTDETLMKEQLNFIKNLSADIGKTTKALID